LEEEKEFKIGKELIIKKKLDEDEVK